MYHKSVLLEESVKGLNINPDGLYVDVTFGGGGHSRRIMECLDKGHLYAFDQDADAARNVIDDSRFTFIPQNFKYMKNYMPEGRLTASWQISACRRTSSTPRRRVSPHASRGVSICV